jgi:hypothetical protein
MLGLASELAGDQASALDAYLSLWRDYSKSPFTTMARLKIGGATIPPSPTPTLTSTLALPTITPTATGTPPTGAATPTRTPTTGGPYPNPVVSPTGSGAYPTPVVNPTSSYP